VLAWAASLAGHSDHPVSKAIATGLKLPENGLTDFVALAGRGVEARTDGQLLFLGNHRLVEERKLCSAEIEARLQVHETQGRTVTMLASAQQVLAIFAVADTIKESSREAVADLHRLGVVSVMLTGDNVATAASIAKEAGIDDARGNLLPEDKLAAIEDLQRRYGPTAMTGDGINDAPALARADIGVAMGAAGTDTAMEAADVVIMNDDLRRIPETIRLSRRTHAVLWQNIGLALGIKAIFLGLAVFGNATMWMAVFADMGASLLVVQLSQRACGLRHAGSRKPVAARGAPRSSIAGGVAGMGGVVAHRCRRALPGGRDCRLPDWMVGCVDRVLLGDTVGLVVHVGGNCLARSGYQAARRGQAGVCPSDSGDSFLQSCPCME
jgi:cation transport ATPase